MGRPICLIAVLMVAACTGGKAAEQRSRVKLTSCHLITPGSPVRMEARCGKVSVPESWDRPGGRKIQLHLAVLPARSDEPAPDPLFFFSGGPGHAATESFIPVAGGFERMRTKRDVVLIDQRGTGRSHPLRCAAPRQTNPYEELPRDQERRWLDGCIKQLSASADLTQYTTTAAIRDFDHVRQQLGYGKINIYGVSYGTRVALSYLRRYPKQVRSAILDGVVPQDEAMGPRIMTEGPATVTRMMLLRCHQDRACRKRFPNLATEIRELEHRLLAAPSTVEIIHPRTGKPTKVKLSWQSWALTLRILGYGSETIALLPLLLHTAHQRQDLGPLVSQAVFVADSLRRSINGGLESSVLCSEDWPFFPGEGVVATARYGQREVASIARLCKRWPHKPVAAAFKKPVSSAAPVLLISGQADPVTPPENAEKAARTLKNSRHLVVPWQGHGVIMRGCMPSLAARFVQTASARGLDARCLQGLRPLGFFLSFAGPEP